MEYFWTLLKLLNIPLDALLNINHFDRAITFFLILSLSSPYLPLNGFPHSDVAGTTLILMGSLPLTGTACKNAHQ